MSITLKKNRLFSLFHKIVEPKAALDPLQLSAAMLTSDNMPCLEQAQLQTAVGALQRIQHGLADVAVSSQPAPRHPPPRLTPSIVHCLAYHYRLDDDYDVGMRGGGHRRPAPQSHSVKRRPPKRRQNRTRSKWPSSWQRLGFSFAQGKECNTENRGVYHIRRPHSPMPSGYQCFANI
jgi:hypothetical protein